MEVSSMGNVAYNQVQDVFDAVNDFSKERLMAVVNDNQAVLDALRTWAQDQARHWKNNPLDLDDPHSLLTRLVNLTKCITAPEDRELRFNILLAALSALSKLDGKVTAPLLSVLISPSSSLRQKWQAIQIWWHHEPNMRWS
jgi:hypothetical protein